MAAGRTRSTCRSLTAWPVSLQMGTQEYGSPGGDGDGVAVTVGVGVYVVQSGEELPPAGHEANIATNARPARRKTAETRDIRALPLRVAVPVYARIRGFTSSRSDSP